MSFSGFVREARRRRVFRVAGFYIVGAWVAVQVFSEGFPALDIPASAIRYVWLAALAGFPVALLFSWFYDITGTGIVRTPPADPSQQVDLRLRAVDYALLAALSIAALTIVVQLSSGIRDSGGSAAPADPLSIAVLPLENLSGDPAQAYFAAGMHDQLISALSRISGLRVTSRTSTRAYADTTMSVPEIARKLGVSNIIEGSVFQAGDKIRIIVQLIDARHDDHLWEASYERELTDILMLQNDITRAIASEVQVRLTANESKELASAGVVDPEAYEAYLKGVFHAERFTPEDMQLAVRFFQRAVELDPDSAFALTGLSKICRFRIQAGIVPPREADPQCRPTLMRALELDSDLPQVQFNLALMYWLYDYSFEAADAAFRRALELNPSYAEARVFYAHFLANLGRPDESTREILLGRDLDPLNPFTDALHGAQRVLVGDVAGGVQQIERVLETVPQLGFGYDVLWFANARLRRFDASYDAALAHFAVTMGHTDIADAMRAGFATGGFESAMLAGAHAAVEKDRDGYVPAMEIALLFNLAGNDHEALRWLNRAWDRHDPTLPYLTSAAPLRNLSDDPRFIELVSRLGLPQASR